MMKSFTFNNFFLLALPLVFAACGDSSSASDDYSSGADVPSSSSRTECPESIADNEFCDTRDYNVYKTSEIGALVWMSEDLKFNVEGSKCFDNVESNCDSLGRLYNWTQVMDLNKSYLIGDASSEISGNRHRGICPEGWHVPDTLEWHYLVDYAGGLSSLGEYGFSTAQSGYYSIYYYRFNQEPAFFHTAVEDSLDDWYMDYDRDYGLIQDKDYYTRVNSYYAILYDDSMRLSNQSKSHYAPLRCVKDTLLMEMEFKPLSSSSLLIAELESSSSSEARNPCAEPKKSWEHLNPEFRYGTFIDPRDEQCYKTTTLEGLVILAENLNYADSVSMPVLRGASRCWLGKEENCESTGRLYTWDAAMQVCPEGWRLPTKSEIFRMWQGESVLDIVSLEVRDSIPLEITDKFGYSFFPTGVYYVNDPYKEDGDETLLTIAEVWLSGDSEDGYGETFSINFGEYLDRYVEGERKESFVAVRCIKDKS